MIRKRNKWHFGQILYLFSISRLKLFMYFDWFFPMNYRRTNTHNNIPFFNHIKQIDSIEKDVFSSCHERGTKKNFDSPWGIELQIFGFLMGTQHFFLCPKLVTRRKKHLSLFLYRAQNLPCLLFLSTNRFHVAATLFSDRSQRMSICGTNIRDTLGCVSYAFSFFFFFFFPYHIFTSFVIYYWTDARQKHKCIFFLAQRAGYLNKV